MTQIDAAVQLSEMQSRELLAGYGVPFSKSATAVDAKAAVRAAEAVGYPVVLKGDHPAIAHKSDAGLVRLNLKDAAEVEAAAGQLLDAMPEGGQLSVQEMVFGDRELIVGFFRDAIFGPCVSVGLGGIFTEALEDVVFRRLPVVPDDIVLALDDLRNRKMLGPLRGKPAIDRDAVAHVVAAIAGAAQADRAITEIDINPLIIRDGRPVAVDALVVRTTGD